ncbi:MAG: class I SAM-dependent methyltransferase [Bacteroidales bacterium]|nr:class I SAM-dependent methyltransferase [Bacteroidales bacterium]
MVTSAGAKGNGDKYERAVSDIAKSSSSYGKYGQLLQRMSAFLKPQSILELGTSLGIGTLYLASGNPDANVITVEACPETSKVATENFRLLGYDNITPIVSPFDNVLDDILSNNQPFGLIYVDGNHTYEATKRYYEMIAQHADDNTVAIFDDINWSKGMSKAWDEIKQAPKSYVAIETLRMGIIFFNSKLTQKIYCARF